MLSFLEFEEIMFISFIIILNMVWALVKIAQDRYRLKGTLVLFGASLVLIALKFAGRVFEEDYVELLSVLFILVFAVVNVNRSEA